MIEQFWCTDVNLSATINPSQNGPGSDDNGLVLHTLQN